MSDWFSIQDPCQLCLSNQKRLTSLEASKDHMPSAAVCFAAKKITLHPSCHTFQEVPLPLTLGSSSLASRNRECSLPPQLCPPAPLAGLALALLIASRLLVKLARGSAPYSPFGGCEPGGPLLMARMEDGASACCGRGCVKFCSSTRVTCAAVPRVDEFCPYACALLLAYPPPLLKLDALPSAGVRELAVGYGEGEGICRVGSENGGCAWPGGACEDAVTAC